jgi:hypothetical protein
MEHYLNGTVAIFSYFYFLFISVILPSLVFYLQSCYTFSLFYNVGKFTTRLSCNNIILQKNTEYYNDKSFFVKPFLPSVFSTYGLFYLR